MNKSIVAAALCASSLAAQAQVPVERPPQFILMAFDNCTELESWQEWSDFSAIMNSGRDRAHFTFFVSGVNFIADGRGNLYEGPRQRRGVSRINLGGRSAEVRLRVGFMNALRRTGHEIASHAVGHFNGSGWSAMEWAMEFRAFNELAAKVGTNNGLADVKLGFPLRDIAGFRAPYLATSTGLYTTLRNKGFRYDTSSSGNPDAWPRKIDGIWRFNLANLRISGSHKVSLSMDYNFLFAQSGGFPSGDPARRAQFREQMVQTYLDYFKANYAGNRAPLHIGHHFFDYQRGAYREALQIFVRTVCGLPEVRCATYSQLADFMDAQRPETIAAYRKGDFPRAGQPKIDLAALAR